MKEQRRVQTRINYLAHALVTSGTAETTKGIIRDVSLNSIYLYIDPVFELDKPVMVEIILLGINSQLTVKMLARVTRKDKTGVAMEFITPLEWWPIFTFFSEHNLDAVNTPENKETTLTFHSRKDPAAFRGDLAVITIENLMQLVSHAALSGELYLVTPGNSAVFFVHEGLLIYAYLEENPLRIGERLIQKNLITKEHLQECLSQYQRKSAQLKIGKILVENGYLQQADLETTIKEQIKDIFFEVLSWKEGSFTFSIKKIPTADCIFLEERIDHLILEGIIHLDTLT